MFYNRAFEGNTDEGNTDLLEMIELKNLLDIALVTAGITHGQAASA